MRKIGKAFLFIVFFLACTLEPVEPQAVYETPVMQIPEHHEVKVKLWEPDQPVNKEDRDSEFTEQEILLLERVTMSEASTEPFDGKVAVAKTIINRSKLYGMSIEQVVYAPYQYSFADNGMPTEEVKRAVTKAINDTEYPEDMIYFREGRYHDFGIPYQQIGLHYFSREEGNN